MPQCGISSGSAMFAKSKSIFRESKYNISGTPRYIPSTILTLLYVALFGGKSISLKRGFILVLCGKTNGYDQETSHAHTNHVT